MQDSSGNTGHVPTTSAGTCPACGAEVLWIDVVQKAGGTRGTRVNRHPDPEGTIEVDADGSARRVRGGEMTLTARTRYMPHHRTCENESYWRG